MDADKEAVRQMVGGLGLANFHEALQTAFNFADKKKSPENLRRLHHRYQEANQVAVKADEEKRSADWNPATRAYYNAVVAPLWALLESSHHILYEYNAGETSELPRALTPSPGTRQRTPSFTVATSGMGTSAGGAMGGVSDDKDNKSLPHHMVIGTRALLALKWLVWR